MPPITPMPISISATETPSRMEIRLATRASPRCGDEIVVVHDHLPVSETKKAPGCSAVPGAISPVRAVQTLRVLADTIAVSRSLNGRAGSVNRIPDPGAS